MIEPLDIEVFDDKEVILRDIVDYDNNITNNNMSEERQREILAHSQLIPYTDKTIYEVAPLLNEFKKVKAQGYAIIDQELEIGLCSIAVPVFDRGGKVIASISISTHILKKSIPEIKEHFLPGLLKSAALLTSFI